MQTTLGRSLCGLAHIVVRDRGCNCSVPCSKWMTSLKCAPSQVDHPRVVHTDLGTASPTSLFAMQGVVLCLLWPHFSYPKQHGFPWQLCLLQGFLCSRCRFANPAPTRRLVGMYMA